VEALREAQQVRELIRRCLAGERGAITQFQQDYGELIYGFPIRAYRTAAEDAGDFYIFAFEKGRIFRRVRTFEGRAPFRAYLLGSVLDHLVLEWKRGKREIETVAIEDISWFADAGETDSEPVARTGRLDPQSLGPCASFPEDRSEPLMDGEHLNQFLQTVDPAKAVVLKLLHVEDYDLSPNEIRHVAAASGRSVGEVLQSVEQLRAAVREREAVAKSLEDKLDAVQAWIQLYERRLQRIAEDLASLPPGSTAAARLREEQAELEGKTLRRQQQRKRLLTNRQRRKITAPYKEIAAILNTTVGNVGSQISRLRQELLMRMAVWKGANGDQEVGNGDKHD
jgi:RNA polymerase sigma factor (sigma-70 family)